LSLIYIFYVNLVASESQKLNHVLAQLKYENAIILTENLAKIYVQINKLKKEGILMPIIVTVHRFLRSLFTFLGVIHK